MSSCLCGHARSCFPMLPQRLPPGHSVQSPSRSGNFSAQTSASLHPSRSASLAGPSHSRGHGRPRSVRKSYRLREKCLFTELLLPGRGAGIGCWMRLLPAKGAGVGWQMLLQVVRGAVPANHRARFQNTNAS